MGWRLVASRALRVASILVAALAVLYLAGLAGAYLGLRRLSVGVEDVTLTGDLVVTIRNGSPYTLEVDHLRVTLYYEGELVADAATGEPVVVPPRGSAEATARLTVSAGGLAGLIAGALTGSQGNLTVVAVLKVKPSLGPIGFPGLTVQVTRTEAPSSG